MITRPTRSAKSSTPTSVTSTTTISMTAHQMSVDRSSVTSLCTASLTRRSTERSSVSRSAVASCHSAAEMPSSAPIGVRLTWSCIPCAGRVPEAESACSSHARHSCGPRATKELIVSKKPISVASKVRREAAVKPPPSNALRTTTCCCAECSSARANEAEARIRSAMSASTPSAWAMPSR